MTRKTNEEKDLNNEFCTHCSTRKQKVFREMTTETVTGLATVFVNPTYVCFNSKCSMHVTRKGILPWVQLITNDEMAKSIDILKKESILRSNDEQ